MSYETTLFAHIAPRLTNRIEDVAVEALGHILSQSEAAREALEETLRLGGAQVGTIAKVQTQVAGEKGERPDLIGFDDKGVKQVLIEAKFWADLTKNQPNQYLKQLQEDRKGRAGALLFVAPRARLATLWPELRRLAKEEEPRFTLTDAFETGGLHSASISGGKLCLLLTSWAALLGRMETHACEAGDTVAVGDIKQLRGLTDRSDPDPFLPWRPEELGSEFALRMEGLRRLVDDAINHSKSAGFLERGKAATGGGGGYGRQIQLGGVAAGFGIEVFAWARYSNTPLWLRFGRDKHGQLEQAGLTDEIFDPGPTWESRIPIELPAGVEYDEILNSVVNRLKSIARQLDPDSTAGAADDSDIRQLRGRADRMDAYAFLPWRPEELEPKFAQQVTGLHKLIDEATSWGKNAGFLQPTRVVPKQDGYGQAIRFGDTKAWFGIHFGGWAQHSDTPLWLVFEQQQLPQLAKLAKDLYEINWKYCIPIELPADADSDAALDSVVDMLKEIADQLMPSEG